MGNKQIFDHMWMQNLDIDRAMDATAASKVIKEFGEGESFLDRAASGRFVKTWCAKHNVQHCERIAADFWNSYSTMGRITFEVLKSLETIAPEEPSSSRFSKKEVVTALAQHLPLALADLVYQYQSGVGGVFLRKWGTPGSQPGQFQHPVGAALSGTEEPKLLVLDQGNNRVQVFDTKGTFLQEWGSAQLKLPCALVVYFEEVHIVSEYSVKVFKTQGDFVRSYGSQADFSRKPLDLAINAQGDIFVLSEDQINVFGSAGQFLRRWFMHVPRCVSITWSGGELFVIKEFSVHVYSESFEELRSWGIQGSAAGQFWGPRGIAVSGQEVFVADNYNHRVQAFRLDGTFVKKWDVFGSKNGHFITPWSLTVSSEGEMFVVDTGNSRVQVFFCCHSHHNPSQMTSFPLLEPSSFRI